MPYAPISVEHIANDQTRELFARSNDYLADVYTMLSSRPLHRTNGGGCNLTATLVLLCVVDALATYVYPKKPNSGKYAQQKRFKMLLFERLPWGQEAAGWMNKENATTLLYLEFRNTLTHALGVDQPSSLRESGFVEPTVGIWGNVRPKRIGNIDARKTWPAHWPVLSVLTDKRGTRDKLTVVALYWAIKTMVSELATTDPNQAFAGTTYGAYG